MQARVGIVRRYAVEAYKDPEDIHFAVVGKGKDRFQVSIPIKEIERVMRAPAFSHFNFKPKDVSEHLLQHFHDEGFL